MIDLSIFSQNSLCRQVKKPKEGPGDSTGRKGAGDSPGIRGTGGEFNRIGGAAGRYTSVGDGSVHAPAASHRCLPQPAGSPPAIALYPPHRPFDAEDTVTVLADKVCAKRVSHVSVYVSLVEWLPFRV